MYLPMIVVPLVGVKNWMESGLGSICIWPECSFQSQCHYIAWEKKRIDMPLLKAVNKQCLCLSVCKSCGLIWLLTKWFCTKWNTIGSVKFCYVHRVEEDLKFSVTSVCLPKQQMKAEWKLKLETKCNYFYDEVTNIHKSKI